MTRLRAKTSPHFTKQQKGVFKKQTNALINKSNFSTKSNSIGKDKGIFCLDGLIRFPATDVEEKVIPPVVKKCLSNKDYSYHYSIEDENGNVGKGWKKKLGFMLASYFKISNPEKWCLSNFPNNYCFVKQEKVKETFQGREIGHKVYLLYRGGESYPFQTLKKFFVHAIWLIEDTSLNERNCFCTLCHRSNEWKKIVAGPQIKWRSFKLLQGGNFSTQSIASPSRSTGKLIEHHNENVESNKKQEMKVIRKTKYLREKEAGPKPTNLPDGWEAILSNSSPKGRWYFANSKTKECKWDLPK